MSLRQTSHMAGSRSGSIAIVPTRSLPLSKACRSPVVFRNGTHVGSTSLIRPAVAQASAKQSTETIAAMPSRASTTSSTSPECTIPARPSSVFAGLGQGFKSAQQVHDLIYHHVNTAVTSANLALKTAGGAPRELHMALQAYAAELKVKASSMLQVSPSLEQKADLQGTKFLLASACMHDLSMDNFSPDIDWLSLHPAIGVPLFGQFALGGHVDTLGLPVFKPTPSQGSFHVTLQDFHALSMQRPHFVGRFLPLYWDDGMQAEAYPYPVVAIEGVAESMLSQDVLEGMMRGFPAGKLLLEAATTLGLASESSVSTSVVSNVGASWFDLVFSHPSSLLGVLLLSRPNMPMAVFLRGAAAAEDAKRKAAKGARLLQDSMQGRVHGLDGEIEPSVCDGCEGGRMWGMGHITAVGAGNEGDGCADVVLPVAVCEAREGEEVACAVAVPKKGGKGGILGRVLRRLCRMC